MKILYIHGYMGHGNGSASRLLRAELDKRNIEYTLDAPQFPITDCAKMRHLICRAIAHDKYDYIVASSLGAFFLSHYVSPGIILVNPALTGNIRKIRDESEEKDENLTDEFLGKLESLEDKFLRKNFDEEAVECTYFLFGTKDNIAPNEAEYRKHYTDDSHIFHCDMGHKLDKNGAVVVCDIIEQLEQKKAQ